MASPRLVVLGAGPVGLFAALRAHQLGLAVEIATDRLPAESDHARIEVVPAQLIALLVEFGVHPRLLGVDRTHGVRLTQWRSHEVIATAAPASAHVSRPALELALLALAGQAGIPIRAGPRCVAQTVDNADRSGARILDATGRCAVTVGEVARPAIPIVCRTFTHPRGPGPVPEGFAVAAGPEGYAYRLSNAGHTTLGLVGHGAFLRGSAHSAVESITRFAPWLVAGIDSDRLAASGAGAASMQWCCVGSAAMLPIGDALFARDALASQGLAIGISDALHAVSNIASGSAPQRGVNLDEVAQHRHRVADLISESPFALVPLWRAYVDFLRRPLPSSARST